MAVSKNTLFDLIRNSYLIPYRFNADGKTNPVIMTDENGLLLPELKIASMKRSISIFVKFITILTERKRCILHRLTVTVIPTAMTI